VEPRPNLKKLIFIDYQSPRRISLKEIHFHIWKLPKERTIRRKLDGVVVETVVLKPRGIVLLMDTTYWKKGSGVMLFKDGLTNENLLWHHVRSETNALYLKGVEELVSMGYVILGIVCDGRRGLIQSFGDTPVQMYQFHQVAIIRKYLTKTPKLPAAIELKTIAAMMKGTDREPFEGALDDWHLKWKPFIDERSANVLTGKTLYTHKRLRSTYRSLSSNKKWLFTWYDHLALGIPNTTNAIEDHFSDLKNKLRNHNGLSQTRKRKFINEFFKA
jgi:hypothetical protein